MGQACLTALCQVRDAVERTDQGADFAVLSFVWHTHTHTHSGHVTPCLGHGKPLNPGFPVLSKAETSFSSQLGHRKGGSRTGGLERQSLLPTYPFIALCPDTQRPTLPYCLAHPYPPPTPPSRVACACEERPTAWYTAVSSMSVPRARLAHAA